MLRVGSNPLGWVVVGCCSLLSACAAAAPPEDVSMNESARAERGREAKALLDRFHAAAAAADEATYFSCFADDGVFLGTDASERWGVAAFRAYAKPHFDAGRGWTYRASERHVEVEDGFAWFEETLENDKLGQCRGTGVLRLQAGEWKVVRYSLTLLVPNERALDVAALIRAPEPTTPAADKK